MNSSVRCNLLCTLAGTNRHYRVIKMKKFTLGQSRESVRELFSPQRIRKVQLGEKKVCVVRVGEAFFAFEALCPHRLASLSEGTVTPFEEVICPLHQYRFDLHTGKTKAGDCKDLECYKTELTESGLLIYL